MSTNVPPLAFFWMSSQSSDSLVAPSLPAALMTIIFSGSPESIAPRKLASEEVSTWLISPNCSAKSVLSETSISTSLLGFSAAIFLAIGSPTPPTPTKITGLSLNGPASVLYHSMKAVELRSYGSSLPSLFRISVSTLASLLALPRYSSRRIELLLCGCVILTARMSLRSWTKPKKSRNDSRSPLGILTGTYKKFGSTWFIYTRLVDLSQPSESFSATYGQKLKREYFSIKEVKPSKPLATGILLWRNGYSEFCVGSSSGLVMILIVAYSSGTENRTRIRLS